MKKRAVIFLSACLAITSCGFAQSTPVIKPIITSQLDSSAKPGDDFFKYVNGKWLDTVAMPASKTRWGSFAILREQSSQAIHQILEDAAKNTARDTISQMIGDFYLSGMDSAAIEKSGWQPIKNDLDKINSITTLKEIIDEITISRVEGASSMLFGFGIGIDTKKTTQYISYLGQGGISLPDRDYYLKTDAKSIAIRNEYKSYITDLFKLIGVDSVSAKQNAAIILDIETKLAGIQLSRVDLRDPEKTYNKFSIADFSKTTPNLNWSLLLPKMLVNGQDSFIINNPSFFYFVDSLLAATPVSSWKIYLQWNIIADAAPYLSNGFVERNFQFEKVLTGQKQISPRWQRISSLIDNNLSDLIGQLYVSRYFKPAAKQRMIALVDNLQQTFEERIKRLDWMSEETKTKAIIKLRAMIKKIGYPDKWKTYNGVIILKNDVIGNIKRCNEWSYNYYAQKLNTPVDKSEWSTTPQTVNAFYNSSRNDITFPAAILQPPFFNFDADDAVNYGAIGAVIGHEMTHGFDDQGRKYDKDGNLNDWWTSADAEKFTAKAAKVAGQFDAFTILDSIHVNGKLTLGENLADLGGINIAYEAFKKTPEGQSATKIDGLSPEQRFFISFALIWRIKALPETMAQLIIIDPHSPEKFRVNGALSNVDEFYKAFNIKEGDKMYKPESERIKIW